MKPRNDAPRRMPMNCYKCGRFIGPDGNHDVMEVDCGVYEAGYPTCRRCMKHDPANSGQGKNTGAK